MTTTKIKSNHLKTKTEPQPISWHLQELRGRLLWCAVSLGLGTGFGWMLRFQLLRVLVRPLNQPIYYTSPTGGFNFLVNLSLFFGVLVSIPVFIFHSVRYIEPALPKKVPRLLAMVLFSSTLLLIAGIAFAYFISLPAAMHFLQTFSAGETKALISTTEYFSFVTRYLFGFGVLFQLPLIVFVINTIHTVSLRALLRFERWVILLCVVAAALLTPTPDIINQVMMALPPLLLYQATILLLWVVHTYNRLTSPPK